MMRHVALNPLTEVFNVCLKFLLVVKLEMGV